MSLTSTRHRGRLLVVGVVAGLVLTACGGDDGADPADTASVTEEMATEPDETEDMAPWEDMVPSEGMTDEMTGDASDPMSEEDPAETETAAAPSLDIVATKADGSTVTLADHAGQPVFVETFATWCSNCRSQLGDTQQAAAQAGDDAVFLALSIETDLDPARLEGYAAENGFSNVTFAVLDDASLATLAEQFGNGVLVPPSTPKFTVATDGTVSELTTGFESADEILAQLDTAA